MAVVTAMAPVRCSPIAIRGQPTAVMSWSEVAAAATREAFAEQPARSLGDQDAVGS